MLKFREKDHSAYIKYCYRKLLKYRILCLEKKGEKQGKNLLQIM